MVTDADPQGTEQEYNIRDGVLYRGEALYIPPNEALIAQVIRMHHDDELVGHFSKAKTIALLSRKYY